MKVLLVVPDLYKNVGGGQTVYKRIIESSPETDFFYFRVLEPDDARRPSNAHTQPLVSRRSLRVIAPPPHAAYVANALEEADQIARSVAGQSFDIVDIPDFLTFGSMLKSAFAHHRVKVGRVVLAMHGNISNSIDMNWGSTGDRVSELRYLERAQFDTVDGTYSISPSYIRSWQAIVDRDVHYIDPAHFVSPKPPAGQRYPASSARPSLYCIGRSERRKGNDLFVELVRWLDPSSFNQAAHIGNEDYSFGGISSAYLLNNIAAARGISVEHQKPRDRCGLLELFVARSIVILPVRYDTLNLVALEALFSGCPVVVSSKAGVCDYLDEAHPNLPYVKIDLENFYAAVSLVRALVEYYDERRRALQAHLIQNPPVPAVPLDMMAVYGAILAAPARKANPQYDVRPIALRTSFSDPADAYYGLDGGQVLEMDTLGGLPYEEYTLSVKHRALHLVRRAAPHRWQRTVRSFLNAPRRFAIESIKASGYFGDAQYFAATLDAVHLPHRLQDVAARPERNRDALKEKLGALYYHASSPLFRCNFWLDIARMERLRGNELMAATYELRLLRLLGDDRLGLLSRATDTLKKYGFGHEAEAAQAMFGNPAQAEKQVYNYLKEAYERLKGCQTKAFEIVDDRRNGGLTKVAVIVSLYNAADKLTSFLTAISQQSLVRQNQVEFVLVDSGSPAEEREALDAFLKLTPLNVVYARSRERETIQAAWNRGIALARAPYLVFLGVDETLYPEALEILAHELDNGPDVDWVMSNSLVTSVDKMGLYKNDIMSYDRSGAGKDHVYLETCYLSWVGGIYRKSLHDRFGYYDEAFGASGDTEFKSRILPHIKVKFIDRILGLFLNYPDGQTTASPRAEIEDLRAWYVHRTPGGIRYAFENRPIEEAEALFCLALGYRKSHNPHISSDIEYGCYLADYIKRCKPRSVIVSSCIETGLREMLGKLRELELAPKMLGRIECLALMVGAWRTAVRCQREHRQMLEPSAKPCYGVLNDNRYEQHSWLWKSI